jgi:hypothetical protein
VSDVLSIQLAKELRRAGLIWKPALFDFFHIPDRDLDNRKFVIADMSIDIQILADGIGAITFNGAVEWSLDYILTQDVIWLPTEAQLREILADSFTGLQRTDLGYRVSVATASGEGHFDGPTAADAYGKAVLSVLSGDG